MIGAPYGVPKWILDLSTASCVPIAQIAGKISALDSLGHLFDAYVYVSARELCGSAPKIGLYFVRRTINWDQHCGASAFWRFLPYLIKPRSLARLFFC
jgi:hypothetical protein